MSPASQGALEVERYIGSCLISSNVRAGLHGKSATVCRKQEQPATVRGGKPRGCFNNGGQGYSGLADQQQCQVQYGGPSGWTGAPLISMTSSPRRCNNQRSSPSLAQQQQQQQQQTSCCADQQQQVPPGGHLHKSPLSRLAIHTQGAPLILAGRFYNRGKVHGNNNNNNSGSSNGAVNTLCGNTVGTYVHNTANPSMTSNANSATSRCPASRIVAQRPTETTMKKPPTSISANSKTSNSSDCSSATGKENAGSSSIANIDSLSIASDESSGSNNSENSLPRIIKPRKRRKKDRKPPNNIVASGVDAAKSEETSMPVTTQRQQSSTGCGSGISGEQMGVVGVKSYPPTCYEPRIYEAVAPHLRNYRRPPVGHRETIYGGCRAPSMQTEMADVRQQRYAHHRHHVQVKVLDDNRNVVATPMRTAAAPPKGYRHHHHHHHHHHANGNGNCNSSLPRRYAHEYAGEFCEAREDGLGQCQCRYCDPAGLIWDVDRNGYSPYLTAPPAPLSVPPPSSSSSSSSASTGVDYHGGHFGQMPPLFLMPPCSNLQERALDRLFDEHSRPQDDAREPGPAGGVVLRRSWSDPTSYFSYGEEIVAPTRDVGVIGDRGGQSENGKHKRTLWRGDSIGSAPTSSSTGANGAGSNVVGGPAASPKGLEVSTEIITSPNGHRDLEIKFYSSPSPAERLAEEDKSSSSLLEEADDDENNEDGDFSDIWSYHESKLQQDFRTLLQAEE